MLVLHYNQQLNDRDEDLLLVKQLVYGKHVEENE